jgi:uncharacterized membrane protein
MANKHSFTCLTGEGGSRELLAEIKVQNKVLSFNFHERLLEALLYGSGRKGHRHRPRFLSRCWKYQGVESLAQILSPIDFLGMFIS